MAENIAFKGKLDWFGLDWFSLVCILMLQSIKEVLLSIHAKFELSRCLVYPTIDIKLCRHYY